ncbi:MAG: TAXI family TRAP transporter solute-binding subunit [Treponema sp.]|nr:TAXI family TRAP transporter solute-binding subunit [Treponema sp.]
MKRNSLIIGLMFLVMIMGVFSACDRTEHLHFATGGTAGTYYPFGRAIARVVEENTGLQIIVQATGASRANIQLIDAAEVDLAIVQNDVMDYAWTGADFFQGTSFQSFNAVAGLYSEPVQVIASSGTGIRTIADLRGRRVSVGDAGSGTEFNARHILAAFGIGFNDINVQNLGFGASADALRDGRIDAFFVTAGAPTPAIIDLATTRDVSILPVAGAQAAQIIQDHPFYTPYVISAGTYRGQTSAVTTLTIKATLIASTRVSEDTIFRLTRSLFEHQIQLAGTHSRGADLRLNEAVQGMGSVPFHPGAERYYRSVNVIR